MFFEEVFFSPCVQVVLIFDGGSNLFPLHLRIIHIDFVHSYGWDIITASIDFFPFLHEGMRGNYTFSSCPGVQLSQYVKNWWGNIYSEELKLEKEKNAPHLLIGEGGRERELPLLPLVSG